MSPNLAANRWDPYPSNRRVSAPTLTARPASTNSEEDPVRSGWNEPGISRDRRVALCLAASYLEGDKQQALLKEAQDASLRSGRPNHEKEIANLRKWSENPINPNLRPIGPATILKNIFSLERLNNPTAEVFYTMLALWKHSSPSHSDLVLNYLGKAAKHAMKFQGKEFVEFLRRLMDFPRRGLLEVSNPNFLDLIDNTVASSAGATVYLPPETFVGIRSGASRYPKSFAKKRYTSDKRSVTKAWKGTSSTNATSPSLEAATDPLDGSAPHYTDGPFTDPQVQLPMKACCLCFNYGKDCKLLDNEGRCMKVHICFHDKCRTLRHHNHRFMDHSKGDRTHSKIPR